MRQMKQAGFTLIQILLMISMVIVLVGVTVPRVTMQAKQAKIRTTRQSMTVISRALADFHEQAGRYPTTREGLQALVEKPESLPEGQWHGPYLPQLPQDGWQEAFAYRSLGGAVRGYNLVSKGGDRTEATRDDISLSVGERVVAETGGEARDN